MKRMKCLVLFTFIIFTFCGTLSATKEPEKKIDVNYQNEKIQVILDDLAKKFTIEILYNHQEVEKQKPVTYQATQVTLSQILSHCLKNTDLAYRFEDDIVVIKLKPKTAVASTVKISGKVVDAKGEPLPGVTIIIPQRSVGVVTNAEGVFNIELLSTDKEFQVSFIGMKTKVIPVLKDKKFYSIVLEEDQQEMEEVVVTGYANINKKSFTGTSVHVTSEELMKASPNNIIQSLALFDPSFRVMANNAAGSNPNVTPEMYIRGRSGLGNTQLNVSSVSESELRNNPNLPTFILDGYEVDVQKIYDLDPSQVKSVTILKDAASTAIYGSRAANGVVVVETITPPQGSIRVNYTFNGAISTPDLSVYNLLDAREKLELEKLGGLFEAKANSIPSEVLKKEQLYYAKLSEINRGVDTYWLSQPVRTALNHKHNLVIGGGSDALRYQIGFRLDQTDGVMKESSRNRKSLSVQLSYRIKKVMFQNTLEWSNIASQESPYGDFSTYASRNPYDAPKDAEGSYVPFFNAWHSEQSLRVNPLYDAHLMSFDKTKSDEIVNNFNIKWFVTEHLRLEGRVALRNNTSYKKVFKDPESSFYVSNASITHDTRGSLNTVNKRDNSWDVNFFAAYTQPFGKHHISATLGYNIKENMLESTSVRTAGFASGSTHDHNFAATHYQPTGGSSQSRLIGLFFSANYTYDNIYLLDVSCRYDGASQFGDDNKFAPFYSFGGGINLHNFEKIKNNLPWLDNLKIRGTYGILGNANFNQNLAKMMYQYNFDNWYADGMGATLQRLGNPSLKWEQSANLDLGIDIGLFKRVTASLGYYRKITNDLIGDITIPSSTGFSSYKSNLGKVMNEGVELMVNGAAVNKKDVQLRLFFSLAHNRNVLKEISDALKDYNRQVEEYLSNAANKGKANYNNPLLRYVEGGSMTAIYAMKSLGINPADGQEIFLKKDGTPTYTWDASQHVICGDSEPKVSGTFGFNFTYKNFYAFTGFTYEFGGQLENRTLLSKVENANINRNVDKRVLTGRWTKPGDVAQYKALRNTSDTRTTSRFIQDNNFIAFNSITLGYTMPQSIVKKMRMQNMKVSVSMNDLGRVSSIEMERGTSYPFAQTYNLTVNVGF